MEVIIALISGLCVAIPSLVATYITNNKTKTLVVYRLDSLEKKVNEHNNWSLRIQHLEDEVKYIKDEVKHIEDKIKD